MKKLISSLQLPEMKIDDRFTLRCVTPENLAEVVDVFAEGYYKTNPIFVALNYSKQDVKSYIQLNFPDPTDLINFLPSLCVIDTQKENKVMAVLHQNDFSLPSFYPQKTTKGIEFKKYIDYRLFSPLQSKYKEKGASAIVSYSSLPEYQNFKIGQQVYNLFNYMNYIAGYKYSVNLVYNIYTKKHTDKFKDIIIVNQINIQDEYLDGKQIFKDSKILCAYSYYRNLEESIFQDQKIYPQQLLKNIEKFYQESKIYFQNRKQIQENYFNQINQQQQLNLQITPKL